MGEAKRYYWLKFQDDFFESRRIKKLRNLGADFVIIYLKMQLLSVKTDGVLEFTGLEETFAEEIALDIGEDVDKVKITIAFLLSCDLMLTNDDLEYILPYTQMNMGSETASAQRGKDYRARLTDEQKDAERERAKIGMREVRARRKEEELRTCYEQVTNVEKEKEKEKDIYILSSKNDTRPPKSDKKDAIPFKEIIDYLNFTCNTNYKHSTKKTQSLINARWKEGFRLEDFKKVIDTKSAEWLADAKMNAYLRPETLFGTKFESYLNQPSVGKDKQESEIELDDLSDNAKELYLKTMERLKNNVKS